MYNARTSSPNVGGGGCVCVCVCGYVVASWPHSKLHSSTLSTLAPQSSPSCPCLSAHDLPSPQRCHLRQDMCVSCLAVPAAVKSCPWPRLPIAQTAAYCQAIVVLKRVGTTSPPAEIHDAAAHAPPALVPRSSPPKPMTPTDDAVLARQIDIMPSIGIRDAVFAWGNLLTPWPGT